MKVSNNFVVSPVLIAVLFFPSCSPEPAAQPQQDSAPAPTNRLDLPPEVVNNLGVTFVTATRNRLGVWRTVPGQLEVPEGRRWVLRAPARGRLVSTVSRWDRVEKGGVIAELTSPELPEAQRAIALAQRTVEQMTKAVTAARERLVESIAQVREARAFAVATRQRLQELQEINKSGNALVNKDLIEAHLMVTDAGKASLDAAIDRDELVARVAMKQLEADQAKLSVGSRLSALSVMTGLSTAELIKTDGDEAAWQRIRVLTVRAPAAGVVVELLASQGETLEVGASLARMFDTSELRFRGHLPEGDLGELSSGNRVRLEFPSRRLETIETTISAPLPVADASMRMIQVQAVVPNASNALMHGLSVMAQVLVKESKNEEVLIPSRCVVFDGLDAIVFKRDPENANIVIRTPVELGSRAANLVEVFAGVLQGDAVVADGIRQLKQTGLGKAPEGGHFHADGTWHGEHK